MTNINIPDEMSSLKVFKDADRVRLEIDGVSTGWISDNDTFLERIRPEKLNGCFLDEHLKCEIRIKNVLDEGIDFLANGKYGNAIRCFDEAIHFDSAYASALLLKSHALFAQRHYVKSLRYYKRAVSSDDNLKDDEHYNVLLNQSAAERENFPEVKRYIFTGDELFAEGDFENALASYDKAMKCANNLKGRILSRLYSKKATALMKLNEFEKAIECFTKSIDIKENDYAYFGKGCCEYELDRDGTESLLMASNITLDQMLEKGLILNETGHFDEAVECFDEILEIHYTVDDLYFCTINGMMYSLKAMDRDVSRYEMIFDRLDLAGRFLGC